MLPAKSHEMNLTDIQKIVIAQAIEESDSGEDLVSDSEKRLAGAAAGAPLNENAGSAERSAFLAKRADQIVKTAESKFKGDQAWLRATPFRPRFSLFALVITVLAAIIGYLTNELDPKGLINLLKFPLIGIIAWNLLVYLFELFVVFRKNGATTGLSGILCRALFPPAVPSPKTESERNVEFRSRSLFHSRWRHLNLPPLAARIKSLLHFTALVLAASAIAGMYVKGLAKEYNAVWESTFFQNGAQLRPFIHAVLGPAASLQGNELPDAAELDQLHWTKAKGAKKEDNAARWINWYALTIAIYVLIPRMLLAVFWHFRSAKMERSLPFREISPHYFDRILAASTGDSLNIVLVPYAHKAGENVTQGIRSHMEKEFERPVTVHWQEGVVFGEEETAEVEIAANQLPMLLFNFASTPEKETHLALFQRLRETNPDKDRPYQIVLDCEAFDRKSESFNDADERRTARLEAWKKLFAAENCKIHVISDHSA